MDVKSAWGLARQWVPFGVRTAAYGTVSLLVGPVTRERAASTWAMRRWCQSSARGLDILIHVSGLENVPVGKGSWVYCSNHQSVLDILVLGAVLPGDYKWAAKRSLMNIPFLGWHLRLSGHVPVERRAGSRAAAEVIARFTRTLQAGKPLLVFPEGTRSEDGIVRPFKNGGFHAAVRGGVPVIPVAIEGTHRLMKKGDSVAEGRCRDVYVQIGAPIYAREGREGRSVPNLRDRTFAAVRELHRALGGEVPATPPPSLDDRQPSRSPQLG